MNRRPQLLFLVALVGVLLCVGLGVRALAGGWAAVAYCVVCVLALVVLAARVRASQEAARLAAGRTCTCCSTSQHDPVKMI